MLMAIVSISEVFIMDIFKKKMDAILSADLREDISRLLPDYINMAEKSAD